MIVFQNCIDSLLKTYSFSFVYSHDQKLALAHSIGIATEKRCAEDFISVYRWLVEQQNVSTHKLLMYVDWFSTRNARVYYYCNFVVKNKTLLSTFVCVSKNKTQKIKSYIFNHSLIHYNYTQRRSLGIGLGACVAVHLLHHATRAAPQQRKALGGVIGAPPCAALLLQSPAIAPALGRAAVLLKSGPLDPFYAARRYFSSVSVPTLIAVGKQQSLHNSTCATVAVSFFASFFKILFF
jgi:hypothetical protein